MNISLLILAVVFSSISPASAAVRAGHGRELVPHLQAIETRLFAGDRDVSLELRGLESEYSRMPDGDEKVATGIVLRAASANGPTSANILFSDHLDREAAAAAGRVVRHIRAVTPNNEPLQFALHSIHDQLWHGEDRFHPSSIFDGAPEFPVAELPTVDHALELPDRQRLDIKISGAETATPPDAPTLGPAIVDPHLRETVIIGGGYAGLSAAWHLRDRDILLLEKEESPGGLAYQGKTRRSHVTYARGAAYYTEPTDEVKEIYDSVGLTDIEKTAIKEPIDSYFYNGELIKDVWSEESLKKLPPGFAAFKAELQRLDGEDYFDFDLPEDIPEKSKYLDRMTMKQYLEPYGPELTEFLDSYGQSALGGHLDQIGALGFLLFYSSEIDTRYTWPGGTGGGSQIMARKLWETHHHLFRTRSRVHEVRWVPIEGRPEGGYEITFERDGKLRTVRSLHVITAAPLKVAAKIFPQMPAWRKALIAGIDYADYIVHSIFSSSDHYTQGYDTWFRSGTTSMTDVITGRWVETQGYTVAHEGPGILTGYMPLAPPVNGVLDSERIAELAARAAQDLRALAPGLATEKELAIEAYRWPSSIHLTAPGYMTGPALELAKPDGQIHYAGNNLGPPAFETALVSGKRAAEAVRKALGLAPAP